MQRHWTWEEAVAAEEERERKRRAQCVRHVSFGLTSGWQRLWLLSIKRVSIRSFFSGRERRKPLVERL